MAIVVYILVQCLAYAIDFLTFLALNSGALVSPVPSNLIGKAFAGGFAFIAHRYVTFATTMPGPIVNQIVKYVLVLAATAILSSILLWTFHLFIHDVRLAKFMADLVTVGLSFVIAKLFIFAPARAA